MKTCPGCKQTKAFTEFSKHCRMSDGLESRCKVCKNASNKKWKQNNPAAIRAYERKRSKRPDVKKKRNARDKERYHTDPQFSIANRLRARLNHALRGNIKSASTITLLGCTVPCFLEHLEQQFQPGMSWENKGTWHLDHMMPCASFDLSDPEQQRQCCHYTNFQPLWGKENIIKKDKILYNREWNGRRWVNKTY